MSTWRARRAQPGPPASVVSVVSGVRSTLRLTRALECLLFFAAALFLTRAAALGSGLEGAALRAAWPLAGLSGALCAAAWWREHPEGARTIARLLDERLRHHGALLTAFELETRAGRRPSPMEALVSARVLARLRVGEALRALMPPLVLPVAAPTLAGLVLVLATDVRRAPPPREVDYLALADGLERALALGTLDERGTGLEEDDPDGGLSRAEVQELGSVLHARGGLPFSAEGWRQDPAAVGQAVEELDRRVAALARRVAPESELGARLEQSRVWLDALRMGLAEAVAGAPDAGTGVTDLTAATGDGTISRPSHPAAVPPMTPEAVAPSVPPSDEGPAGSALGLQAGNWWPAEYDAVVARWMELSEAHAPR